MKAYNLPIDYVLYEMSYANMIMYGSVLPSYNSRKDNKGEDTINADDPQNREIARKLMFDE